MMAAMTGAPLAPSLAARLALLGGALYHIPLVLNDFPTFGGGARWRRFAVDLGRVWFRLEDEIGPSAPTSRS
jgi:hypothetical protein